MKKLIRNPFSIHSSWRDHVLRTPNGKMAVISSKIRFFWMPPTSFSTEDGLSFSISTENSILGTIRYYHRITPKRLCVPQEYRLCTYPALSDIFTPGTDRYIFCWRELDDGIPSQSFSFWLFGRRIRKTITTTAQVIGEIAISSLGDVTVDGISCGNWF